MDQQKARHFAELSHDRRARKNKTIEATANWPLHLNLSHCAADGAFRESEL